jgi:hypothetical protein
MSADHSCEKVLVQFMPDHAQRNDGDRFVCTCGVVYQHECDEAEGCSWVRVAFRWNRSRTIPELIEAKRFKKA